MPAYDVLIQLGLYHVNGQFSAYAAAIEEALALEPGVQTLRVLTEGGEHLRVTMTLQGKSVELVEWLAHQRLNAAVKAFLATSSAVWLRWIDTHISPAAVGA